MKTTTVKLTGIRPTVMHNGLMADPTNPYTRRIKAITSKGSKKLTDSDFEERDRLEWEAGLYWDDKDGLIIPADNIERVIQAGGQKSRIGKDIQAAVFCVAPHAVVEHPLKGKSKEAIYADPRYTLRKGVKVQQARIIRVRPMIPVGWVLRIEVEYDDSIVNERALLKALTDAGSLVGIGDWRPKFGRFLCEKI